MRKFLFFIIPILFACVLFGAFVIFIANARSGRGALQITSIPQATVFLNGKIIGKTPLCKCDPSEMLPTGNYTIELSPISGSLAPYEDTITINSGVLTVVDRTFGDVGKSSGSLIDLASISNANSAELYVTSIPTGANLSIDGNASSQTPIFLSNITASDHEVTLSKTGYAQKTIRIHGVLGYKLSALVYLATDISQNASSSGAAPLATASGILVPTPIGSGPTPTGVTVKILDTPTGFLRVRSSPSLGGSEIAQVHPGDTYPFVAEQNGWFEIKLSSENGWVSSTYAAKQGQ